MHRPAFARRTVRTAAPWFAAAAAALGSAVMFAEPDSGSFALDGLIEGWLATASMESDAPLSDPERQERKALPLMPRGFVLSGGGAEASADALRAEMEPGIVDVSDAVAPDVASSAQPSKQKRRRFRAPRTKKTDVTAAETRAVPNETASDPLAPAKQSDRSEPRGFEPVLK